MSLVVQLFGPYADTAGCRTVELQFDAQIRVDAAAVLEQLAEQVPALQPLLTAGVLAVNQRCVSLDHQVQEGDELAVIGLVGGG